MNSIKQILGLTLCIYSTCISASAQQTYRTREGDMIITMSYNDTIIVAGSHQLIVTLNYETGDIAYKVPYESFRTYVDSIDSNFLKLRGQWMEFKGKLGIPYINTRKHPPQNFEVEGTMISANPPAFIRGKGTLVHITSGNEIACNLTLNIQFTLSALGIQQAFFSAKDPIQIDIQQAVLKRVNE